jgi:hypothetical protein
LIAVAEVSVPKTRVPLISVLLLADETLLIFMILEPVPVPPPIFIVLVEDDAVFPDAKLMVAVPVDPKRVPDVTAVKPVKVETVEINKFKLALLDVIF